MRPGDGDPGTETRGRSHSLIFIKLRSGVYYSPEEQRMGYAPWENNIHRAFIVDKNETLTPSPGLKGTAS